MILLNDQLKPIIAVVTAMFLAIIFAGCTISGGFDPGVGDETTFNPSAGFSVQGPMGSGVSLGVALGADNKVTGDVSLPSIGK